MGLWQQPRKQLHNCFRVAGAEQITVASTQAHAPARQLTAVMIRHQSRNNTRWDLMRAMLHVLKARLDLPSVDKNVNVGIVGREAQVRQNGANWIVLVNDREYLALQVRFRDVIGAWAEIGDT